MPYAGQERSIPDVIFQRGAKCEHSVSEVINLVPLGLGTALILWKTTLLSAVVEKVVLCRWLVRWFRDNHCDVRACTTFPFRARTLIIYQKQLCLGESVNMRLRHFYGIHWRMCLRVTWEKTWKQSCLQCKMWSPFYLATKTAKIKRIWNGFGVMFLYNLHNLHNWLAGH